MDKQVEKIDLESLKLTDEEINKAFDSAFDKAVNFDHKPSPEEIFMIRLKAVAQAQLAKFAPYVEQEKHRRDLVWMGKLIDAGITVMDNPDDLPDNLYTQAVIDDARRETAREIFEAVELELEKLYKQFDRHLNPTEDDSQVYEKLYIISLSRWQKIKSEYGV